MNAVDLYILNFVDIIYRYSEMDNFSYKLDDFYKEINNNIEYCNDYLKKYQKYTILKDGLYFIMIFHPIFYFKMFFTFLCKMIFILIFILP